MDESTAKEYFTAAAQRSQRKMPERVAPAHHASLRIFLRFSALSASRRCVFAVKSWTHTRPLAGGILLTFASSCGPEACAPSADQTPAHPVRAGGLRTQCGPDACAPSAGQRPAHPVRTRRLRTQCGTEACAPSADQTPAHPVRARRLRTQCGPDACAPSADQTPAHPGQYRVSFVIETTILLQ